MPPIKSVALVRDTTRVDAGDLTRVAAALQKQVLTDFAPRWSRPATVDAFLRLEDVPVDHWPMIVRDDIPYQAEGIHLDNQWGPFALVRWASGWSLTASHECLEMLADPYGRRLRKGPSLKAGQGSVQYLVEVCDPSEAEAYAYDVDGIVVSDFYTRAFFDPSKTTAGRRYSFTGAIKRPRQVLRGGYISWRVASTGEWWQQTYFGSSPQIVNLGAMPRGQSPREFTDGRTRIPKTFFTPRRGAARARRTAALRAAGGPPVGPMPPSRAPGARASRSAKATVLRAHMRRIAGVG
jgi:hypothetical protein